MNSINEIINNLKDRFANPLLFSFIISWVVYNWEISVAVFWLDNEDILRTGYSSLYDLINCRLSFSNTYWIPLVCALLYTILMPISKILIKPVWSQKTTEELELSILKGSKMPFERYYKLKKDYDKRTEILEEIISKENEFENLLNTANTQILNLQVKERDLKEDILIKDNILNKIYNMGFLNGYWFVEYSDTITGSKLRGTENIYINGGIYYIFSSNKERVETFVIRNFHFDVNESKIFFIKERNQQTRAVSDDYTLKFNINNLLVENEDLITGWENGTIQIKYTKRKFPPQ